jgi:Protein of unknown function (DUF3095)
MTTPSTATAVDPFYADLPRFTQFTDVTDRGRYRPLPSDWLIGVTDVVDSTGAIAAGRYKAVNMVGASAISAVLNGLKGAEFPFVFGGDGAAMAVPAAAHDAVAEAMAAVSVWAEEQIGLKLRAAIVPVEAIRAAGHDVTIARYAVSDYVANAMFSGGGIDWAEREMKAGRWQVLPAPAGTQPNLEGLSCRWSPMKAQRGTILSLIASPRDDGGATRVAYAALATDIIALTGREATPVPDGGPSFGWPPKDIDLEARASQGTGGLNARKRQLWLISAVAWLFATLRRPVNGWDPVRYRRVTAANTDYRKFSDGLKLTVDCSPAQVAALEARLEVARAAGVAWYGLHLQDEAIMTCIVPSIKTDDHMHFVDGAAGGYAKAAEAMKRQMTGAGRYGAPSSAFMVR